MSRKFKINFKCPDCGRPGLIERNYDCIVDYDIPRFLSNGYDCIVDCDIPRSLSNGDELNSDDVEALPGSDSEIRSLGTREFKCMTCEITIAHHEKELFDWLKERDMLEEIEA